MHASIVAMAGDIYGKLGVMYEKTGRKRVVDSAFCRSRHHFLIKCGIDPLFNSNSVQELRLYREATAARQTVEWGMRALQGAFPRSKDRIAFETRGERRLILLLSPYSSTGGLKT